MPRIQPIERDQTNGKAKILLDGVQKTFGMTPNLMRTLAHSPAALEAYLDFGKALGGGRLGAPLREQIALAVAGANSCHYCASAHTAVGKMLKLDGQELSANLQGASGDPKVEAALRFAQRVVESRGWVSDQQLQEVRQVGYTDEQIIEIIAAVALNIFSNYFNHIAETEVDFPAVEVAQPASV